MSGTDDELSQEEIDRDFALYRTDPERFLEVTNERVERRPDSARAYFGRHQAWERLGCLDLALADLDKSLALGDHFVTQRAKGGVLHAMGRYCDAISCLDRSQLMAPAEWPDALGPLLRADCYAQLGDEAAALADCAALPDDHWTPGVFGLPAGNKQEVAAELRRRAAAARERGLG
ncbi:MAG TPA: tetratricopeptide repeat protein [Stellaceae bacterium]|nr:tetratricopeptide repeat protein [Stellaceae bacterium]